MGVEILIQNGETWLVCGGRRFFDREMFNAAMSLDTFKLRTKQVRHMLRQRQKCMADLQRYRNHDRQNTR